MTPTTETREKLKGALAFFQHEAAGGLVLVAAAVAALVFDNSPLTRLYERVPRHARGRARRRRWRSTSRCCCGSTTA